MQRVKCDISAEPQLFGTIDKTSLALLFAKAARWSWVWFSLFVICFSFFDIWTELENSILTFKILFWHLLWVRKSYFDIQNPILTFAMSRKILFWHSHLAGWVVHLIASPGIIDCQSANQIYCYMCGIVVILSRSVHKFRWCWGGATSSSHTNPPTLTHALQYRTEWSLRIC